MRPIRTNLLLLPASAMLFLGCAGEDLLEPGGRTTDSPGVETNTQAVCTKLPAPTPCDVTLWPGGLIPYTFGTFKGDKTTVRNAMKSWTTATAGRIKFLEDPTAKTRVVIDEGSGCSSGLPGRLAGGGIQRANWAKSCPWQHELGHLIGLYHEHQRWDRDRYIAVNVNAPNCSDYDMYKRCPLSPFAGSDLGEYNVSSIEQYESVGSPPDLTLRSGALIKNTTQSGNITELDAEKVIELYAPDWIGWTDRWRSMGVDPGDATKPLSPNLVGFVQPDATRGAPASAYWRSNDKSLNIAVVGTDGAVYWRRQPSWSPWGAWTNMAGVVTSPVGLADGWGNLMFMARGTDGALWTRWHWGPWANSGKPGGNNLSTDTAPAAVIWTTPNMRFYVLAGGHIWERGYDNGTEIPWRQLSDPPGTSLTSMSVARGGAGTAYLFARTSTGIHLRTLSSFNTWSTWTPVLATGSPTLFPSISATADDEVASSIVIAGKDGNRFAVLRRSFLGWSTVWYPGGLVSLNPSVTIAPERRSEHYFRNGYKPAGDNTIWSRMH